MTTPPRLSLPPSVLTTKYELINQSPVLHTQPPPDYSPLREDSAWGLPDSTLRSQASTPASGHHRGSSTRRNHGGQVGADFPAATSEPWATRRTPGQSLSVLPALPAQGPPAPETPHEVRSPTRPPGPCELHSRAVPSWRRREDHSPQYTMQTLGGRSSCTEPLLRQLLNHGCICRHRSTHFHCRKTPHRCRLHCTRLLSPTRLLMRNRGPLKGGGQLVCQSSDPLMRCASTPH